ncbi:unnamed protein product [Bursaphelenchus okinawaensis]|uniref:Uncharacterized protein n=1 Tax=Bursaphelenchus okinawaensis TaxID=465554 RepID=A0A811KY31_9BILA|nr:unnamed protein product [Bursaphelenchus okinawaensis]CAG9114387.1 unnamed protein product [Bursaphelenchus okinawaensis]
MRNFLDGKVLLWFLFSLKLIVFVSTAVAYFLLDSELVVDHEHWSHVFIFVMQTLLLYGIGKSCQNSLKNALISLFPPSKVVQLYFITYLLCVITIALFTLYYPEYFPEVKRLDVWCILTSAFFINKIMDCFARKWQFKRFKAYLKLQNSFANVEITEEFSYLNYNYLFSKKTNTSRYNNNNVTKNLLIYEYVRLRRYANLFQRMSVTSHLSAKLLVHNDLISEVNNHMNMFLVKDKSLKQFDSLADYQLLDAYYTV